MSKRQNRVTVRGRVPNLPECEVIGIAGKSPWTLWTNLKEREKLSVTEYEKWTNRINELKAQREKTEKKAQEQYKESVKMLSFGRPSKALHDFKQELQRMDDAIKHAENERGKYRADYIRQRMKAIDERLGELKDKLKPYQAKAEKARRSLEAAEKALQDANNATHYENNKLINEKHRLQHELNELEPEPLESEHDAAEWLKLLRQGKIKTIVGGQDPNLDKAYSQYTREKTLIKDWARRNKVARTTEGDELPPPDCLKEWPHNRVREITGAAGS